MASKLKKSVVKLVPVTYGSVPVQNESFVSGSGVIDWQAVKSFIEANKKA